MIRTPALLLSSAVLAAATAAGTLTAAAAPADPVPHCQPFQLSEPGHTYNLRVCNAGLSTPSAGKEHQWVVDGSDLQNGAVIFGDLISSQQAANGTVTASVQASVDNDWHCQQYGHLNSYDCIAASGFLYGGEWAYVRDFYEHPNPSTDLTLSEAYFKASSPNGYRHVPQYYRRLIVVDDGRLGVPVELVNWDVTASSVNPPPPQTCMILAGPKAGKQFRCTQLEQKSILDYWARGQQITGDW
jgi:hypothetical protein